MVKIPNLTKGFMRLLNKDTPFSLDERAQKSFDALNQAFVSAPVLSQPVYSRDFFIYAAASMEMVGLVLV